MKGIYIKYEVVMGMKKLTKISILIWILLLMVPNHLFAANRLPKTSGTINSIIPAIAGNDINAEPVDTATPPQNDAASESRVSTDNANQDGESLQQNNAVPPVDGIAVTAQKPAGESAKRNKPGNEGKGNESSTATKLFTPTFQQPDSKSTDRRTNKLQLENILLYIGSWWSANPSNLQIWYIFCLIGFILYLCKLRQFRQPLLFLSLMILGFYLGSSLDPIAAVFNIIPKTGFTFDAALFILGIAVFLSFFLGRFYCGWLCPLGAIQELIHPGIKIRMPDAPDAVLKYLKYLILVIFLYLAWRSGDNLWSQYEPLKAFVHFKGSALALFLLVVFLALSVLIERPFCRYICPLGAILSLTSRLAVFRMRADAGVCMVCGKCSGGDCPMNAIETFNAITDVPKINNAECIYCLRCQKFCQRSALRVSIRKIDKMSSSGNTGSEY
jgi:Polyferredoxin